MLGITLDTSLSLRTSSVCIISTFGRCDICDRRSSLSRQNRWQLPLSVLGSIIVTASCMALRSGTSTVARRYRTRWLASCIRLPSRRAPRLCANSCTRYRSDNGSRTNLLQGEVLSDPTVSSRTASTIRLPEHFNLLPLHCFTDHLCPPSSSLGRSTVLCTSSLELSRDIHKIGEHFQ